MASSRSSARSRPASRRRESRRYGCEVPRLWTKPLRKLTPRTSLGFDVIVFAEQVLLLTLLPWQRWLLIHALELRVDGGLRFRNVVVLVARQNGKSTLSQVLALWWLYVCGDRLVLGTAQDLDTAEEVWQGAVDLVLEVDDDDQPIRPELAALVKKVVLVNGKKSLDLTSGERYKVKAANRRAARGLTGKKIVLDELREHQTWDAWAAITKTTMAQPDGQVWCLSNAGDVTSVVLRYLRKLAHQALEDPDGICAADAAGLLPSPEQLQDLAEWDAELEDLDADDFAVDEDDLAIFEWSAAPGCDRWDRDAWAQANPSLGYTISERTVASAARTDPEWVFRTEVLCQWADGSIEGPFPAGSWQACGADLDEAGRVANPEADRIVSGRVAVGLEVSRDRGFATIGVVGHRADGLPQGEVAAHRSGTDWVVGWFCDPAHPARASWEVVVRPGSAAWSLADDLADAGVRVVEWKGAALGVGCAQLFDAVKDHRWRHLSQPVLNIPAGTAVTRPSDKGAWVWDSKRSPGNTAPLWAVTGAYWQLLQVPAAPAPPPPLPEAAPAAAELHELATAGF